MQKVHIVPHTHWDREWYKPFQYFRTKLVYVMDALIDILEKDADFTSFLFDAQTITLEDYLHIRPENRERLKKLIAGGRIVVGPWYIQPDEFAPDGESLIRNLMIGTRIARAFGEPMMVGHLPDSFGHSGGMPQILKGFGIDSAVIMRGVDEDGIGQSEFTWRGVNGDAVLGIYLQQGYTNGMFLPEGYRENKYRIRLMIRGLKKWASTSHLLIMNGVDHQFPQAHIPAHVKRLNAESKKTEYLVSTLKQYIDDVRAEAHDLPVLVGDLLTPANNRVHSSIASTRIYQKQMNRRMEALLEKYVEPVAVMAWLKGAVYQQGLINEAWKVLIQNQTHDGLCGCCLDEVHREMDQRFVDVKNIGETLQNTYTRAIGRRVSCDDLKLIVFNNAMLRGTQTVRATVFTNKADFTLLDGDGKQVDYQVEQIEDVDLTEISIWTLYLKAKEPLKKMDIVFNLDFNFNAGYKVLSIKEGVKQKKDHSPLSIDRHVVENEYVKVAVKDNGSIDLTNKESGNTFTGLHIFEDCGDAGDTYNYSPVLNDRVITTEKAKADIEVTAAGPVFAEVQIGLEMEVPSGLAEGDKERTEETVTLPIQSRMRIYARQKRIEFSTTIDNQANDHRLRILFPVGFNAEYSHAETQFGTITRDVQLDNADWKKKKWKEKPLPIYSQQKFVDLQHASAGLAILNRGLPEYEIYDGDESAIAVTLVRGVGMMGKGDLLIRPGRPSGILAATPDAQCSGKQTLEYAIYPHVGADGIGTVPLQAAAFDASPLAVQSHLKMEKVMRRFGILMRFISMETMTRHVYDQLSEIPAEDNALINVNDDRLIISALKKAENEEALIVRLYNASEDTVDNSAISMGLDVKKCYLTDFNEVNREAIQSDGNTISVPCIKPYSAITFKFIL